MRRALAPALAAVLLAACGGAGSGGTLASPTPPTPAPSASTGAFRSEVQLKYRLLDEFGPLAYCDPDFYPIARADEASLAKQREDDMRADADTWTALVAHHPIIQITIYPPPPLSGEQLLPLYRDWKMLRAIALVPPSGGSGGFGFSQRFVAPGSSSGARSATLIEGTIDRAGSITVAKRTPGGPPNCPICLARGTRIATPIGEFAVEELRAGMAVWTADADGARVSAVVLEVGSALVPADHEIVDLALSDGRRVRVSPGHPTADGRRVGELRPGDRYGGATVASAERVRYGEPATFDLLPSGPTGAYWANGVLLDSTLR